MLTILSERSEARQTIRLIVWLKPWLRICLDRLVKLSSKSYLIGLHSVSYPASRSDVDDTLPLSADKIQLSSVHVKGYDAPLFK